ncbi:MAG: hypothetical protein Q9181_002445 [Wetmoreana brouardii]
MQSPTATSSLSRHIESPSRSSTVDIRFGQREGPTPQLPAFLRGAVREDPGTAARAQYSGTTQARITSPALQPLTSPTASATSRSRTTTLAARDENAPINRSSIFGRRPTLTSSSNENAPPSRATAGTGDTLPHFPTPRSGPSLPAFLTKAQPPRDPGAAAREQYGLRFSMSMAQV